MQAGDALEMLDVQRDQIEVQMQRGGADEQVCEFDADAAAHLLAVNASGQAGNGQAKGMNGD